MAASKQNVLTQSLQLIFGLLIAAGYIYVMVDLARVIGFSTEIMAVLMVFLWPYIIPGLVVAVLCVIAALIYDPCSCCCKAELTNFKLSAWISGLAALIALVVSIICIVAWWQLEQWVPYKQYTCCKAGEFKAVAGYNWESTGSNTVPTCPTGATCTDRTSRIASALALKQAFTAAEWTAFGINDLKETDFALAGGTYYKPMPLATSKDPLSDAQYEKYTASAQCTDSTCTSPNGEGGNDCIADGIDGGIVNWQSRLMVREPMTCSGTDKAVKVDGVVNEAYKAIYDLFNMLYKILVWCTLAPVGFLFFITLFATIYTCQEVAEPLQPVFIEAPKSPQYVYSPPPPTYMVPMEQEYMMYDAPMEYEMPYEMPMYDQNAMVYPAVQQPYYHGYDQNFQMNDPVEMASGRYPYAGAHY